MKHTPPMFATGQFTLSPPFDTVINASLDYTVIAIRGFNDWVSDGVRDIYTDIYAANGLTAVEFDNDTKINATIVTLFSTTGEFYFVPDTYILSFPNINSIGLSRAVVSVDIRTVPDLLNLEGLMESLKGLTRSMVGIEPQVKVHKLPIPNSLTQADYDAFEAARLGSITDPRTDGEKVIQLEEINQRLREQMGILTQMLRDDGRI